MTAILATTLAAAMAAGAEARGPILPMAEAKRAARAAVAPLPVESVLCVRPSASPSGSDRSRALCLITHPAAAGETCRSLVAVKAPRRYGLARARVIRINQCVRSPSLTP